MLIFEKTQSGLEATTFFPGLACDESTICADLPAEMLRSDAAGLPEVSELQVVRHYTNLSKKNFSIDTHFYPLGSCTMKYNPRAAHTLASLPGFLNAHPLAHQSTHQGLLTCIYELQEILVDVCGMEKISLAPMAGAQGELAGVMMIKAYHRKRGEEQQRFEMLVPDAAHGTNPASAVASGFKIRELPTLANGDIDLEVLRQLVGPQTAGIMLTNPSTLGVFERNIQEVARAVHEAGGLLYYDGANLNAILGKYRPGDMGFDVMHLNLHKTFATPHGGGGPGSGPIVANRRLAEFLPVPMVKKAGDLYCWETEEDMPESIGQLSAFMGNMGVLVRAFIYARMLGKRGMVRVAEHAALNANYLMDKLSSIGYTLAFPERRASHEFIITLKPLTDQYGVTALDLAKRLLDYGFHAPTIYFPLLVPECLLIEPTETESKEEIDRFIEAMAAIYVEIETDPDLVKRAPITCPVNRLDEVKAARELDLHYRNK
jgi:glycine dehydrogenase subunit 2